MCTAGTERVPSHKPDLAPYSRVHDNHMGLTPFLQTYQTVPNINKKNSCIDLMFAQRYQTWYNTPKYQPHAHECMITYGDYHSRPLKPSLIAEVLYAKGLLSASCNFPFRFSSHNHIGTLILLSQAGSGPSGTSNSLPYLMHHTADFWKGGW